MKKKKIFNKKVLESINSPNVWTPETENKWIKELFGMSKGEIYEQFPPMRKPPHIGRIIN